MHSIGHIDDVDSGIYDDHSDSKSNFPNIMNSGELISKALIIGHTKKDIISPDREGNQRESLEQIQQVIITKKT